MRAGLSGEKWRFINQGVTLFVLFSSMPKAEGTVQFLLSFADTLRAAGKDVRIFLPKGVCDEVCSILHYNLVHLSDTIPVYNRKIKSIVASVRALVPEKVIFTDEARGSLAVLEMLRRYEVKTALVVHDPTPHPSRAQGGLRRSISQLCYGIQRKRAFGLASEYILLSDTSAAKFREVQPELAVRSSVMPLCPHPPVGASAEPPAELCMEGLAGGFYLFFGRIDEYKGLVRLLHAYRECGRSLPLVVAGSGVMSDEERELADGIPGVLLINRFISDSEMVWLFSHCLCVCLPYIEASQSGVLAMSYYFGKPVIASDLDGLTEFVSDGESGLVFRTVEELSSELDTIALPGVARKLGIGARHYLDTRLDWGGNVRRWLQSA